MPTVPRSAPPARVMVAALVSVIPQNSPNSMPIAWKYSKIAVGQGAAAVSARVRRSSPTRPGRGPSKGSSPGAGRRSRRRRATARSTASRSDSSSVPSSRSRRFCQSRGGPNSTSVWRRAALRRGARIRAERACGAAQQGTPVPGSAFGQVGKWAGRDVTHHVGFGLEEVEPCMATIASR